MTITHNNIPYRFRETAFRRYERFIQRVLEHFPATITLDPTPMSVETFSNRFRDAVKAQAKFRYSTFINMDKFDTHHADIGCRITSDGMVELGNRNAFRTTIAVEHITSNNVGTKLIVTDITYPIIDACLFLLSTRTLATVTFRSLEHDAEQFAKFVEYVVNKEQTMDITIVSTSGNELVVV